MNEITIQEERLSAEAYIAFLARTDLGSQYPKERFEERIAKLVQTVPVSLTARNEEGKVVGVCFGITDFSYWLFITDLGVDREYVRQGIGKRLLDSALTCAGGKRNIIMYTCANKHAVSFYEKWGMKRSNDIMEFDHADWTPFTVGE